jgi:hypothetical protein
LRIRVAQTHPVRGLPKRSKGQVVLRDHLTNVRCARLHC